MHCRTGRKVRTLSIEDAYTREMLAIEVDTSLSALRVVRVLEKLQRERGLPVRILIDHGTEFTSKALDQWAYEHKVTLHFITPGRRGTARRASLQAADLVGISRAFRRA
jgi:putative transposase